ncbi:MAG: SPX domain protein involved in polyphosphate accumulation [Flavobacteriaceae bacterium]|jgi:SPX domain protein involved in polyphosphate accumulation|uniref:hypothetical protein n=1 Tax=Candidatus Marifrigoribacter sp. Uisw_064 TaxID=3230970 RepID=UPI003AE662BD
MKCNDANHICDKTQYKESSFWEKIKLNLHLLYCSVCRKYSANNSKLSEIMNQSKIEIINTSEKEKMREQLKKEMAK